ncbi:MAG: hypothetical protein NW208_03480 [Bryobacter sp.]|nr:hypothetical protein [Bryobacter sp.]
MSIQLSEEVERNLVNLAYQRGMSVDDYLQDLLARETTLGQTATFTHDDQATAFLAWADSFPDTPSLASEAKPEVGTDRSMLYPDRW